MFCVEDLKFSLPPIVKFVVCEQNSESEFVIYTSDRSIIAGVIKRSVFHIAIVTVSLFHVPQLQNNPILHNAYHKYFKKLTR
jgi:hypothetical protein